MKAAEKYIMPQIQDKNIQLPLCSKKKSEKSVSIFSLNQHLKKFLV